MPAAVNVYDVAAVPGAQLGSTHLTYSGSDMGQLAGSTSPVFR